MDLLFRILYAAHASGPHHKLALDALTKLRGASAEAWRRLFLLHAEGYMTGAKAPDTTFKDFKNHVLHVQENNWGGAPGKARAWYGQMVSDLSAQRWAEAVYAAGVLSHYVVDPVMPFHTGQSDEESTIHRAAEWSISRSYDGLRKQGEGQTPLAPPAASNGAGWLEDLVTDGARTSNPFYWDLIKHYDFARGVSDPPAGLDARSREIVAGLLVYASSELALVLERAFAEAGVVPPEVSLTAETVLATLKIPLKFVTKKLDDAADRREVEAMYAELLATGKVDQTLAPQEKIVRALHAKEVLAPRAEGLTPPPLPVVGAASAVAAADPMARFFNWCSAAADTRAQAEAAASRPVALFAGLSPAPVPATAVAEPVVVAVVKPAVAPALKPVAAAPVMPAVPHAAVVVTPVVHEAVVRGPVVVPVVPPSAPVSVVGHREKAVSAPHAYLAPGDDIERAPSIGTKTADRLRAVGVHTVAELLAADAARLSASLDTRHIKPATVTDWQDQARLVIGVPGLRGTHAQLLVGAGFRTPGSLTEVEPDILCARVLAFATTAIGQRILHEGHPPEMERIVGWRASAVAQKAA